MPSEHTVIHVDGVSKCYELYDKPSHRLWNLVTRGRRGSGREFWALRDIGFEVARGECVGILGANGSGKSTLLQIVSGTLEPTGGAVGVAGRIAALLELGSGFHPDFTGRQNVTMNGAILGLDRDEIEDRFAAIEEFAGIGEFIDQPVKTYSSGMILRLAFAVQVQVEPDVLVIDEALAVGDARFQLKCFHRLEKLLAAGTTVLFVSHSIEQVRRLCTRGIVLDHGRKVMEGDPVECGVEYYRILFPSRRSTDAAVPTLEDDLATVPSRSEGSGEAGGIAASPPSGERHSVDLDGASHYGRGGARVTSLTVAGGRAPVFEGGEILTFAIEYRFDLAEIRALLEAEPFEPVVQFGLRFDTHEGVVLTDLATGYSGSGSMALADLEDREDPLHRLEFRVRMPHLRAGDYFVSPGVALGVAEALTPLVEYVHLFSLTCQPRSPHPGLMRWDYEIEERPWRM